MVVVAVVVVVVANAAATNCSYCCCGSVTAVMGSLQFCGQLKVGTVAVNH